MFVDEISGEKAVFTYKPDSTVVARGNYDNPLPELWQSISVATTSYKYQLLFCNWSFYSGFFMSGYTNCYKSCRWWGSDYGSPYFQSASSLLLYAGVAFNVNGHQIVSGRLMSVGLR